HQRHVLANHGALHRLRPRAGRQRQRSAGRYSRQAPGGEGRQVSVRTQWQGSGLRVRIDRVLPLTRSQSFNQIHRSALMSSIPANLKYLDSHEWARLESDGTVTIGISDHAQGALGDLVFVEVPEVGRALTKGGAAAVVESVKAASDVYSPVSGEVVAANAD